MRIIRHTALAATALIASVALTACQGSTDGSAKATNSAPVGTSTSSTSSTSSNSSTSSDAKPDTASAPDKVTPAENNSGTTAPKAAGNSGSQKTGACTAGSLKMTASSISRPINHVLITATNAGSKTCDLYYAPAIAFSDDAQSPIQVDKDTQPQAVVTLSPGESGYAMIRTSGEPNGDKAYSTQKIRVNFQNRNDNGSVGGPAYAQLAGPISVVDSQSAVTYWQSDVSAVSAW
ncbi:DUF4232 domain-containing protein [Streptomyces beijiangensis]|uniref:DUF4232 domain-containing protein n=1 Tax=Streptomyces beijiangensis TaxID=163361 RepID=A0A939JLC7_9ACTN|nr:DUF4232 domain-containing protein [Streptomyces beijiangensis]MBO0516260.1 DUF4232 domain-containing protein [Streptomyces beijiangensis]